MRKKREFIEGAFYHVTSRTNDKIRVFDSKFGKKNMLMVLQEAKDKFLFELANFCIMPTHIHLLIKPAEGTNLSVIMHWIKTRSAKRWNSTNGSTDHMWGNRFYARIVNDAQEFDNVMAYIDQNPVKAGIVEKPEDWQASGAFYRAHDISDIVDFSFAVPQKVNKLAHLLPLSVRQLLPPKQLEHTIKYFGAYAKIIEKLSRIIPAIPKIGESDNIQNPIVYLHYVTKTADYYIYEYDGNDTMYGKVRFNAYPDEPECQKLSLSKLKGRQSELNYWLVPGTTCFT
ncbi:MAG: transposase [Treponema sp.]|jgi:putative transposase|nr:transposase [Treponema sp.]